MGDVADYQLIQPPSDLITTMGLDPTQPLPATPADLFEARYIRARCLTAMRQQMIASCDAVLALGGRQSGFGGKYPGIVEEAYLALRDGKPLFLLGGFGGDARSCHRGTPWREARSLETPASRPNFREAQFAEMYNRRVLHDPQLGQEPIDYAKLSSFFAARGVEGLNNGLNSEENGRLFTTVYLDEAIFLLLTGLKPVFKGGSPPAAESPRSTHSNHDACTI